jgi:glycosyltransferase involved in cell wall biosynthesis
MPAERPRPSQVAAKPSPEAVRGPIPADQTLADAAVRTLLGNTAPPVPARRPTRPLRIALIHGVGFFYSGGGEKLVIQQVLGLRERGHDVDCFAPIVDSARAFPGWLERLAARRLAPRFPNWTAYPDALAIIAMSAVAPVLALGLRSYDVILAANQPAPWVAWWARRLGDVPYVIYLAQPNRLLYPREIDRAQSLVVKRDYVLLRTIAPLVRPLVQWADRRSVAEASVALGNGAYMSGLLSEVYGREFISCPAGAPILAGDADRARGEVVVNGTRVRKPFVLLTNRHYPQKRFDVAIASLRHRDLARRGVELVITGQETAYTSQLRDLVAKMGLADRVRFVGLASESDLAALYRAAACYVYPSPEEDYGMGVVEAMGAATPVVAWNCAGPTGTVVDGVTGWLVPPGDEAAFAEQVAELVTDATGARRMGEAAQDHARKNFTMQRHYEGLEDALSRAIAIGPKAAAHAEDTDAPDALSA